jgi:hypothetical protein
MRAVLAGLFTFGGLLVCGSLASHYFLHGFGPPKLMANLFELGLFLLAGTSFFLITGKGSSGKSLDSNDVKRGLLSEDGQIIGDRSYGHLKHERLKGKREPVAAPNTPSPHRCASRLDE